MANLPDLVLAVQVGRGPGAVAVAHRTPGGHVEVGRGRWPEPVPAGALFLHWPRAFPWEAASYRFFTAVRDGGGEALSLNAVLDKLGLGSPRTLEGVADALDPELGEVEDSALLVRRWIESLAEKLAAEGSLRAVGDGEPRSAPPPVLADALASLPDAPGVYAFHGTDGGVLYVGKAASLRARVSRHFAVHPAEPEKSRVLADRATALRWEETGSELEALVREQIRIRSERPPLNAQEAVRERPRGAWRNACVLCVLPSAASRSVEACLVGGDGRFHWERLPRRERVPRGFRARLGSFLEGVRGGWAPGAPGVPLSDPEAAAHAEVTLSWLVRHGEGVSRIDLRGETPGRLLDERLRRLFAENPAGERIEVVSSVPPRLC